MCAPRPACLGEDHLRSCLNQLVRKVNDSHPQTIYSYTGDENHSPIYYEETHLFKQILTKVNLRCQVVEVSDRDSFPLNYGIRKPPCFIMKQHNSNASEC